MQISRWQTALAEPGRFAVSLEAVPGRGQEVAAARGWAREAWALGTIDAVTVTDNPSGEAAFAAVAFARALQQQGVAPLVHLTLKDSNRNQLISTLYALAEAELWDVLLLTGDYPQGGYEGRPKPVFDLDAVQALHLLHNLPHAPEQGAFFAGAAVNPFKLREEELLPQYAKLRQKCAAGARFLVTQVGYSARKLAELQRFLQQDEQTAQVPLIANLFVLPLGIARRMQNNEFPGCLVTPELVAQLSAEKEAGIAAASRIKRAAQGYAVAKGLGYKGVHLGGMLKNAEEIAAVLEQGEALSAHWQAAAEELEYFPRQAFWLYPGAGSAPAQLSRRRAGGFGYAASRCFHWLVFRPEKGLFPLMRRLARGVQDKRSGRAVYHLEHKAKTWLYDCKDCGDCALPDSTYLCPMSRCPKQQRNGPCGGSYDGWCEVWPGQRLCFHSRIYQRLRDKEQIFARLYVPPCDWHLFQHASWIGYYLGHDHAAKQGVTKPMGD